MEITPLIETKAELTDGGLKPEPIVISTRIRLARNIAGNSFPGWADLSQRKTVFETLSSDLSHLKALKNGNSINLSKLDDLQKKVLVERRLISRELTEADDGAGVLVSKDQRIAIMINEEDHLRIQSMRSGFNFKKAWKELNALDSEIEEVVDFAFSEDFGYLTACPTNVGTGLRASAMLHLPGLVMREHMEKVVRMVNQLGMAVRGNFGEGSEATGSIFQISNQQTLGESENSIITRLINVLHAIIEQESNARLVLLEDHSPKLFDKIGRAYGILLNGHLLSSDEAVNLLSLMRLAVDLNFFPHALRGQIDRLMMEVQPGHVQYTAQSEIEPQERDMLRAQRLREQFAKFPTLTYSSFNSN